MWKCCILMPLCFVVWINPNRQARTQPNQTQSDSGHTNHPFQQSHGNYKGASMPSQYFDDKERLGVRT